MQQKNKHTVNIIGAGLAGCEAANYLAQRGVFVNLYDIKPQKTTPAHSDKDRLAELVCSNSLKNNDAYSNACGLLKEEMRLQNSLIISAADKNSVPAGGALAVDRQAFSQYITQKIKESQNIKFISQEITDLDLTMPAIIATGPLTTDKLFDTIKKLTGGELYFYDAAAPIIEKNSIDMDNAFFGERYKDGGDYINCPLDKDEYYSFVNALISARRAKVHEFEKDIYFEGCMPVEVLAERGIDTLRFGPLKPRGLTDPKTNRYPYACLQLRKEDAAGSLYNLVGFQTNLAFSEQKRVFSMIKALKNAEFVRYGVMHRNTYINSPAVLNFDYSMKEYPKIFFAGQITGVEGYVESASSGLTAAINLHRRLLGKPTADFSAQTVTGALQKHISTPTKNFQPMNANYGILEELQQKVRDKKLKKQMLSQRAIEKINSILAGEL